MADPLIQVSDLTDRLGRSLDETETTQAEALIDDASALIRDVADDDFLNDSGTLDVPPSIVPVVVTMVRRALENPRGLSGEQLGSYSWQAQGQQAAIYANRNEKRIIRRAVSKLGVGTAQLEGYLPLRDTVPVGDDLLGS